MTQRKGEKPTISIQEHMAIDVCPGPIQPIKQISDYFPRYPRGLPPVAPQPAGHAGPLRSALSTPAAAATTSESDRPNEDSPERACAGASASLQAVRRDEEPDVEGYDSDDSILFGLLSVGAQTEMKKVVGDNATLPCHHQFPASSPLDIEWLLQKPNSKQKVIITFFGGQVYTNEAVGSDASRLSFAGEYLGGDASLLISDLLLTDSGEYYCKVKTGGKYHWSQVNLIVLEKPSKPRCRMDGKLLEGKDVKLSCKSSDGSDPISYKWERVLDKGKSLGKLPNLALIDLKNPEIVTLRNLTMDSTGVYRCTASNDVGEENCTIEVTMQHVRDVGTVAGVVVGISLGVLIVIIIIWLVFWKKEKKKYEEEETPNEIREDAEAPKAKLVKPNSLSSSRSGSSRSGASSTQSMVHNSTQRGHRPRPPAVAALKENGQPPGFPQSPPAYTTVVPPKTPEPPITPKFNSRNMSGPTPPTLMVPAQTKAFQTV